LSVAAIGSFFAGMVGTVALAIAAVALSNIALRFNAPEFFLLALIGIVATASLTTGSPVRALMMGAVGLAIGTVGTDPISGNARLTFGSSYLVDGFDFLPVAIGLFGIAEVLASLENTAEEKPIRTRLRDMWLTGTEWAQSRMAIVRGSAIGFVVGLLPGAGATVAAFLAYVVERRFSKNPEMFGKGALDGVASSESANNSSVTGALAPMLALGIPGSTGTAVLLAALILQGIRPGPTLMVDQPVLVWSLIASMFVGNVVLLIMNLPLAPLFAALLRIPYVYLAPAILTFSLVGAYAATMSFTTLAIAVGSGFVGYLMIKADLPRAPLVLALVLAPLLEESLRQSLLLSLGSPSIFIERPFSVALLVLLIVFLAMPFVLRAMARRKAI
jgi:putative tricarboxylic transport membrane protein